MNLSPAIASSSPVSYPGTYPQQLSTEILFEETVRQVIGDVRQGMFENAWLLLGTVKQNQGLQIDFTDWDPDITDILGRDLCQEIGHKVCRKMQFTVSEAKILWLSYQLTLEHELNLPPRSSWVNIFNAKSIRS